MSKNETKFKYRKEHAILSDTLPFETPASFTNRYFYLFLLENKITITEKKVSWYGKDDALDEIIKLIFGLENEPKKDKRNKGMKNCDLGKKAPLLIPFNYEVRKEEKEFRPLTIPHPLSQIKLANFYDSYKETIVYYCSSSSFSIRKPFKVEKQKYYPNKEYYQSFEKHKMQYESPQFFFKIGGYNGIYKFYNSYQYHKAGRKYNQLLKLDISKCFDSIYTHSISWAIFGKSAIKKNLDESKNTFPSQFDKLIQSMNYNETNGIIIGPESSRVFAEILLQQIDKELEISLDKKGLRHKVDYEIFRYVDDYFVFYNKEYEKKQIVNTLERILFDYKLRLNKGKEVQYDKLMTTEISSAVQKIKALLKNKIITKNSVQKKNTKEKPNEKGFFSIKYNGLITEFEAIIRESSASYDSVLNATFSFIEKKCTEILNEYVEKKSKIDSDSNDKIIKDIIKNISDIMSFVFYIYSVSPKVNTSIRLCRIIHIFTSLIDIYPMNDNNRHSVRNFICTEIIFSLKKIKANENIQEQSTQIETLYLLTALSDLGENYKLDEKTLAKYFNIEKKKRQKKYSCDFDLNYFSYTTLLLYIKNDGRYKELKSFIEKSIKEKILTCSCIWSNTELIMLMLDTISCPFVSIETKRALLKFCKIKDQTLQDDIINYKNELGKRQLWFTIWEKFYFSKELDTKKRQHVY